jgi:hypothetical protein
MGDGEMSLDRIAGDLNSRGIVGKRVSQDASLKP